MKRIVLGGLAPAAAAGLRLPPRAFARWGEGVGPAGPIVFVAAYALLTVALVPGIILTLAAGAVFGIGPGAAYVFAGGTLGAGGRRWGGGGRSSSRAGWRAEPSSGPSPTPRASRPSTAPSQPRA